MMIINAVHMIILVMPTKRRKETTKVKPRHVDSIDPNFHVPQYTILGVRNVVQIPVRFLVVFIGAKFWFGQVLI